MYNDYFNIQSYLFWWFFPVVFHIVDIRARETVYGSVFFFVLPLFHFLFVFPLLFLLTVIVAYCIFNRSSSISFLSSLELLLRLSYVISSRILLSVLLVLLVFLYWFGFNFFVGIMDEAVIAVILDLEIFFLNN